MQTGRVRTLRDAVRRGVVEALGERYDFLANDMEHTGNMRLDGSIEGPTYDVTLLDQPHTTNIDRFVSLKSNAEAKGVEVLRLPAISRALLESE